MSAAGNGTNARRVAVTGFGVVAPIGIGKEAFWASATAGRSGVGPPTMIDNPDLPLRALGEIAEFDAEDYIPKKLIVRSDRNTHFAFASAAEALGEAGLDLASEEKSRIGIVLAANYGGLGHVLSSLTRLHQKGPSFVSAYMATAWLPSAPVGQLSIFYGTTGYSKTVVADAAGGTCAIGTAFRAVRRGDADVVLAGGFEIPLAEAAIASLATWEDICRNGGDPAGAFRPFDLDRRGVVIAEGGGLLVLEELERARARDATIYAEIAGYGMTTDAVALHEFAGDGVQYTRAMRLALEEGGLQAEDVDYVNADGHATEHADRAEAQAIQRLLGERTATVPVSAPKSMTGNALAGAGPIDAAFALLAMQNGTVPPTINLERQDPECRLALVANEAAEAQIDVALVCSRGTCGANAVLALRRV
jgi:3-oxoacyl-[acyl-carrier-protein] synthase II